MSPIVKKSHSATELVYHLVCPIKYRRKIFTKDNEPTIEEICLELANRYELFFLEIGIDNDHIHFLIQSIPNGNYPLNTGKKLWYYISNMNKNIAPELQTELQEIANKDNVAIISFIAPDGGVRTSPVSYAYAQIQESEMYKLEETVNKIPKSIKELHLVIHTPGGELHTSYKIAAFLRKKFEKITAFVPYQAASGGTLICCAANEIVISEIGNITPVDPQVRYKDSRVSAYAFERSVETIKNLFGEYSPMEMPPPWRQMAEKMDPVLYDEMDTSVFTTLYYIKGLLEKSGYTPVEGMRIAMRLVKTMFTHSYSILKEDAKELGLKVVDADATIMVYQKLVAECLKEKSSNHVIDYYVPNTTQSEAEKPGTVRADTPVAADVTTETTS